MRGRGGGGIEKILCGVGHKLNDDALPCWVGNNPFTTETDGFSTPSCLGNGNARGTAGMRPQKRSEGNCKQGTMGPEEVCVPSSPRPPNLFL
jgi:hypothetical protein|mmetsp:Transcript_52486/g.87640  ORF Transcript_52486/g.87640 Transcript_52486/m.87640 type:complete len:92 (-) Transcript_52486:480-755(-)